MTYHAIGLMSGSSLDGLDIAFVQLTEKDNRWRYEWIATECIPYNERWIDLLRSAKSLSVPDFLKLHSAYGHYTGQAVHTFLKKHPQAPADLIASHGHTVFHEPASGTTCQIGNGASIAAETGLPVVSDLRSMDVAYGGQGAPIVPLGEQFLFPDYDYWLNLGGIANITYRHNDVWTAFDVCACNQVLNALATEMGQAFDENGILAAGGQVNTKLLETLNRLEYFKIPFPKSLDNAFSQNSILPVINASSIPLTDKLCTVVAHIAQQITAVVQPAALPARVLATGGGALNDFLIRRLSALLREKNVMVVVPDEQTVQYKEALIMALLGVLRWRGGHTVLRSVTGARISSIGGALWLGYGL